MRCLVCVALPKPCVERLTEVQRQLVFPRLTLAPLNVLPIRSFVLRNDEERKDLENAVADCAPSVPIEISLTGVQVQPTAKHPRSVVALVKRGKRPLQDFFSRLRQHHLLATHLASAPARIVPKLELARWNDIKPPLLSKDDVRQLYFIDEICSFTAENMSITRLQ